MGDQSIYEIIRNDAIKLISEMQKIQTVMQELKKFAKGYGYKINEDTGAIGNLRKFTKKQNNE